MLGPSQPQEFVLDNRLSFVNISSCSHKILTLEKKILFAIHWPIQPCELY